MDLSVFLLPRQWVPTHHHNLIEVTCTHKMRFHKCSGWSFRRVKQNKSIYVSVQREYYVECEGSHVNCRLSLWQVNDFCLPTSCFSQDLRIALNKIIKLCFVNLKAFESLDGQLKVRVGKISGTSRQISLIFERPKIDRPKQTLLKRTDLPRIHK